MRAVRVAVAVVAVTAGVANAQPATSRNVEGERHLAAAKQLYAAAKYDEAIVELESAWAADPQPDVQFAIAQAYRLKGDCTKAIAAYGAYLRTGPKPEATKATQRMIDQCAATLPAPGPQAPAPAPTAAPVAAPTEPMIIREVQRVHTRDVTLPWYRDTWGDVLAGTGVAFAGAGLVAAFIASDHESSASNATTYEALDRESNARDRARLVSNVAFTTGGVLVIGGLVHYVLRPRHVRTEVEVDPVSGSGSIGVSWSLP